MTKRVFFGIRFFLDLRIVTFSNKRQKSCFFFIWTILEEVVCVLNTSSEHILYLILLLFILEMTDQIMTSLQWKRFPHLSNDFNSSRFDSSCFPNPLFEIPSTLFTGFDAGIFAGQSRICISFSLNHSFEDFPVWGGTISGCKMKS